MTARRPDEARAEPYGYVCHRCMRCCHDKRIQINPYEAARLARSRGQSTTAFRTSWTEDGEGVFLRRSESGACVFLAADGCSVHSDRPLACRIYPLAWRVEPGGAEYWFDQPPHPETAGDYTIAGTIADYLGKQETSAFMRAYIDYLEWVRFAHHRLEALPEEEQPIATAESDALLDMDLAIAASVRAGDAPAPTDIEERKRLHLKLLYDSVTSYLRGDP